eukprot:Pgem_evm1s597
MPFNFIKTASSVFLLLFITRVRICNSCSHGYILDPTNNTCVQAGTDCNTDPVSNCSSHSSYCDYKPSDLLDCCSLGWKHGMEITPFGTDFKTATAKEIVLWKNKKCSIRVGGGGVWALGLWPCEKTRPTGLHIDRSILGYKENYATIVCQRGVDYCKVHETKCGPNNTSTIPCIECEGGYYLHGNLCKKCQPRTADCKDFDNKQCFGNSNDQTCLQCNDGFALDNITNTCNACHPVNNCKMHDNQCFDKHDKKCTQCNDLFVLDNVSNSCDPCQPLNNCKCFDKKNQKCLQCNDHHTLDNITNTCSPCQPVNECKVHDKQCFDKNDQKCLQCNDHHTLDNITNTCNPKPNLTAKPNPSSRPQSEAVATTCALYLLS